VTSIVYTERGNQGPSPLRRRREDRWPYLNKEVRRSGGKKISACEEKKKKMFHRRGKNGASLGKRKKKGRNIKKKM